MNNELKRTYTPFNEWKEKSKQTEYTKPTPLLGPDGTLNAKGWARHNVFEYDRNKVRKGLISRKEWDFYTITDGRTILPFDEDNTRYFMTTKQACMPTEGYFRFGDYEYRFTKDTSFCAMDWGRVNTIHKMVWYWGSGSMYHTDEKGEKHLLGFEITWAIGNESHATETCIFYDGKVHKFGAVDVEKFPKDRFMEEWKIISEDGRFNMTMKPTFDNHSDVDFKVGRMNCHQIYGIWNGDVTLDDGTKIEIKDLFAFCEYVENRW